MRYVCNHELAGHPYHDPGQPPTRCGAGPKRPKNRPARHSDSPKRTSGAAS